MYLFLSFDDPRQGCVPRAPGRLCESTFATPLIVIAYGLAWDVRPVATVFVVGEGRLSDSRALAIPPYHLLLLVSVLALKLVVPHY